MFRPALISLLAAVALWVSDSQYPAVLALLAYGASSILLTTGYWSCLLGSSDVVSVRFDAVKIGMAAGEEY